MEKSKRIEMAKQQAEATIAQQRELFKKREEQAALALKEFENKRSLEREKLKKQSEDKALQLKQIFEESLNLEQ